MKHYWKGRRHTAGAAVDICSCGAETPIGIDCWRAKR